MYTSKHAEQSDILWIIKATTSLAYFCLSIPSKNKEHLNNHEGGIEEEGEDTMSGGSMTEKRYRWSKCRSNTVPSWWFHKLSTRHDKRQWSRITNSKCWSKSCGSQSNSQLILIVWRGWDIRTVMISKYARNGWYWFDRTQV